MHGQEERRPREQGEREIIRISQRAGRGSRGNPAPWRVVSLCRTPAQETPQERAGLARHRRGAGCPALGLGAQHAGTVSNQEAIAR